MLWRTATRAVGSIPLLPKVRSLDSSSRSNRTCSPPNVYVGRISLTGTTKPVSCEMYLVTGRASLLSDALSHTCALRLAAPTRWYLRPAKTRARSTPCAFLSTCGPPRPLPQAHSRLTRAR